MVSVQRHLALLRGELRPGEAERAWLRADRLGVGHSGALLVTDRRLLFCGLGFVGQSQAAWPFLLITGAEVREEGRTATLVVHVPGGDERFAGRAADVRAVLPLLPASATGPDASLTEQLERLAALRASGALTDAEFATAKQRLLS